jgi:hypothetical protein
MADGIFGWKDAGQPLQVASMETKGNPPPASPDSD